MERIKTIINFIEGKKISFEDACEYLRIDPESLTGTELCYFDNIMAQCDNCKIWRHIDEMVFDADLQGDFCCKCFINH